LWSTITQAILCGVKKSLYSPGQKIVAEKVRKMRAGAGLTQRDLAKRIKRPLNVISRIETEQRRVDFMEWVALCEACGVNPVESGRELLAALVRQK
jgi:ribosome-binding protein aMBF1 (putative translation factor)